MTSATCVVQRSKRRGTATIMPSAAFAGSCCQQNGAGLDKSYPEAPLDWHIYQQWSIEWPSCTAQVNLPHICIRILYVVEHRTQATWCHFYIPLSSECPASQSLSWAFGSRHGGEIQRFTMLLDDVRCCGSISWMVFLWEHVGRPKTSVSGMHIRLRWWHNHMEDHAGLHKSYNFKTVFTCLPMLIPPKTHIFYEKTAGFTPSAASSYGDGASSKPGHRPVAANGSPRQPGSIDVPSRIVGFNSCWTCVWILFERSKNTACKSGPVLGRFLRCVLRKLSVRNWHLDSIRSLYGLMASSKWELTWHQPYPLWT